MTLTPRQQQVLDFLRTQIHSTGLPPTIHELMAAFGWSSPTGAAKHLQALAAKGVIALSPGKARGIRLLGPHDPTHAGADASVAGPDDTMPPWAIRPGWHAPARPGLADDASADNPDQADALHLPLLGRVAAGQPILSGAQVERHLLVDRWIFHPQPDFLLRVQGDSMIDDNILDGDLVAGKHTPEATHGQIVIARVDGGITIKRLWRRDNQLRLRPRNARHAPIDPDPHEDFAIEGIYCGLLRRP
ncbi:MAG: transcriptional repressor LexA [Lautropia sp.]|nr:transcriptional repressor LexA [Lautropia sp.]